MPESVKIVKQYYDNSVQEEWERIENRPEFIITSRFIDRYVRPDDKILDIGGGPGRYSIYLAQKGCNVTLFDLSEKNIRFAEKMGEKLGLCFKTTVGDARYADEIIEEQFDHILLMGPMYHLLEERDRVRAVNAALKLLKPGGMIFISFINMAAGMIYAMKIEPDIVVDQMEQDFYNAFYNGRSFAGEAFTQAYFARQDEILPFMEQFPLKKLHFFSQEGILSPCEDNIMSRPKEIVDVWLDICEKTCEREELLSWGEHLMYIGQKKT
mgnify:FL=1